MSCGLGHGEGAEWDTAPPFSLPPEQLWFCQLYVFRLQTISLLPSLPPPLFFWLVKSLGNSKLTPHGKFESCLSPRVVSCPCSPACCVGVHPSRFRGGRRLWQEVQAASLGISRGSGATPWLGSVVLLLLLEEGGLSVPRGASPTWCLLPSGLMAFSSSPGLPSLPFPCSLQALHFSHLILATGSTALFPGKFNRVASREVAIQAYEDMVKQVSRPLARAG